MKRRPSAGVFLCPDTVQRRTGLEGASLNHMCAYHRYGQVLVAYTIYGIYTKYSMWQILEHKRLDRRFKSLPLEILKRYEKWKDIVSISGPTGLRAIQGFSDESLRGQWKGFRSSRLGQQYRVIYKVEAANILVKVVDLIPHDYRKR
jgi:proteic killer suppression protein